MFISLKIFVFDLDILLLLNFNIYFILFLGNFKTFIL